jgi:hypothetical protein
MVGELAGYGIGRDAKVLDEVGSEKFHMDDHVACKVHIVSVGDERVIPFSGVFVEGGEECSVFRDAN